MSDDLKVDWAKPIEAVHVDGRVVAMELAGGRSAFGSILTRHTAGPETNTSWNDDGTDTVNRSGWRIRNVADVPCNFKAPSDDIAKRMEAFIRHAAAGPIADSYAMYREARAIEALMDQRVDADLLEARKIANASRLSTDPDEVAGFLIGKCDKHPLVVCALAAIKLGRKLERDSRGG
ncbi:hypothetical protein [Sphingomonas parapaucimobilis]|uniref:Uncharacterized protein n=1 Tax=Sphingomonas parapaucimobilis NBRC 15100 TaxID=1219049 RepID=A0A0A1W9B4_9SPHN|nr:hypothetical protein [Sphingomonas parapaucimobilis]GAM01913.1 hypothetical protein SP5_069_01570 [Sphingomonas parapaucimobilis NBRC 15100]